PVLIDVIGSDDIGVVEGGPCTGLAIEPCESGRDARFGHGEHLDGHAAAHEHLLAEKDISHTPATEPLQPLILPNGKAARLPLQQLLSLEVCQDTVVHQETGELAEVLGYRAQVLEVTVEARLVYQGALAHQSQEIVDGRGNSH